MWSSFRVSDAAFKTALDKILKAETMASYQFWSHVGDYLVLHLK